MDGSWIAAAARALAAAGMLAGVAWADDPMLDTPTLARQPQLDRRVAELEAQLARTQAALAAQQAALRRHEGRINALPGPDEGTPAWPTSYGSANDAANVAAAPAAAATEGGIKLSDPVVVGSDLNMKARWNNGLLLETPAKDFTIHVGGRFHYDWAFFDPDDALELPAGAGGFGVWEDGAFIRRARFQIDGKMWAVIDYNVELDWAGFDQTSTQDTFNGAAAVREVVLQDTWVQASELPVVGHFRAGHMKQPIGLENYNSSKFLTFMERGALHDAFLQEYDPGFLIWDNALEEQAWWGTGFYRIDSEETGIDFGDGEYAWTSRVCTLLWDNPDHRYLMHVGGAYSLRGSEFDPGTGEDVVRFRARPEVRGTPRLVDTGTIACEDADLWGAEAAWVSGPLSVQAEYMLAHVDDGVLVPAGTALGDADFTGSYVFVSYFLTGEHRPYDPSVAAFGRVKPYENFWLVRTADGCCLGRGAWEVAARYSNVDLANSGVNGGDLDEVTLGLNWYWNPNVRFMFNYVWADRDINLPAQEGDVNIFALRTSLDF
jgi:phosphate-selective porin OprO/OprP